MIDLDIEYARKKSFWLDLQIIFKTVPALIIQTKELKEETKVPQKPKPALQGSPVEQP